MRNGVKTENKCIEIKQVGYLPRYKLRIQFSDGKINVVDFEPFLKSSKHPSIQAYLEEARFKQFTVDHGFLQWNDFDLVFPMADLYAGKIS